RRCRRRAPRTARCAWGRRADRPGSGPGRCRPRRRRPGPPRPRPVARPRSPRRPDRGCADSSARRSADGPAPRCRRCGRRVDGTETGLRHRRRTWWPMVAVSAGVAAGSVRGRAGPACAMPQGGRYRWTSAEPGCTGPDPRVGVSTATRIWRYPTVALVVQKYGGASVESAERIRRVAERIVETRKAGNDVVVVVSAMGDSTDELVDLAQQVNPAPPGREMDMLLTAGERISNALVAMAIESMGAEARSFTGSQAGVVTTAAHGKAKIIEVN